MTESRGRVQLWVGAAVVLAAATGCSESVRYGRVTGVVTVQGERLSGVRVLFMPNESKGKGVPNPSAFGVTDAQGAYVLQTPADRKSEVRVGTYRVVIDDPANTAGQPAAQPTADGETGPPKQPAGPKRSRVKLPAKYADMLQTPLPVAEVKEGDQTFDFDLKHDG